MIELLKLTVRAVLIERDADGRITGETVTEPAVIYAPEHFEDFMRTIHQQIEAANEQSLELKDDRQTHRN